MTDVAVPAGRGFGRLRQLTESDAFEGIVATLLVLNAGALAVELLVDVGRWDFALWVFFLASQGFFVLEIVLRVASYGPRFQDFFKEGWNVFDLVVIAASLVPVVGTSSYVARLVRVLRALRALRLVSLWRRRSRRDDA